MFQNTQIPYESIARYIHQESDQKERERIEMWINTSVDNQKLFEQLKDEWKHIHDDELFKYPDIDETWDDLRRGLFEKEDVKHLSKNFIRKIVAIAASVALLIGVSSALFIKATLDESLRSKSITVIETPQGQKMKMTLPDGTQIWLNSGSQISYSENFNKVDREVSLLGEAFFDVAPDINKNFIVHTSDIKVIVRGTAFDISAYPEDENISVSLMRGLVSIEGLNNEYLTDLHPNEMVVISKKDLAFNLYKNDAELYCAWKMNELIFYNTDIIEVVKKLERWYGVNIKLINPDLNQKYTFAVKTETLRELLELFDKITPVDYYIDGKEVIIKYR